MSMSGPCTETFAVISTRFKPTLNPRIHSMPMPVSLTATRSPSPATEIDNLVDEILAHSEDQLLEQDMARWREDLQKRLEQLHQHPEQGLGFIEEHIRQASLELQRLLVQKAMQGKANTVEEKCPDCGARLTNKKGNRAPDHGSGECHQGGRRCDSRDSHRRRADVLHRIPVGQGGYLPRERLSDRQGLAHE